MKKIGSILLVFCILISIAPQTMWASDRIKVGRVSVDDSYGIIDVDFISRVIWSSDAKVVSVKDNKGKSYKGYLVDKDDDDCEIFIQNMKYGRTYRIQISGIMKPGSSYRTITIKVKVPARKKNIVVKKVKYESDYDDGRMEYTVSFDFKYDIRHKRNSYILIQDSNGKAYSSKTSYVDWDDDECEVHLSEGLTSGKTYTYEIKSVKPVEAKEFSSLKGIFTVR